MAIVGVHRHEVVVHDLIAEGVIMHGLHPLVHRFGVRLHMLVVVDVVLMLTLNILQPGVILLDYLAGILLVAATP